MVLYLIREEVMRESGVSEDIGIVSLPLERDEETVCTLEGSDYAALLPKRNAGLQ